MSDVAKHGSVVGHGVIPSPIPPIKPIDQIVTSVTGVLMSPTVFDGDDYTFFDPSFDIEGAAARAVAAYDRNNDGAIDLGNGGLIGVLRDETSRVLTGRGPASIEQLAQFADESGNNDGSTTAEEIADVIRKFDQGNEGDGRLSGQERETFLEVFGEERRPILRHVDPFPFPKPFPYFHREPFVGDRPQFRGA